MVPTEVLENGFMNGCEKQDSADVFKTGPLMAALFFLSLHAFKMTSNVHRPKLSGSSFATFAMAILSSRTRIDSEVDFKDLTKYRDM